LGFVSELCFFFSSFSFVSWGWLAAGVAGGCSWWMGAGRVSANIIFSLDLADVL
jgi:hypothetical protein